jgi:predicted Zn-dependent protease
MGNNLTVGLSESQKGHRIGPYHSNMNTLTGLSLAIALGLCLGGPARASPGASAGLPNLGESADEGLSSAGERRLGEVLMRRIRATPGASLDDPELEDYLRQLAVRLSAHNESARGQSFELFAVQAPSLNAFALPGGFIGVHTGLVLQAQSESELASVIAHEIAHVTQRHIARMLEQQKQSSSIAIASLLAAVLAARSSPDAAGGLIALGGSMQMQQVLGYSRDAEREADRVGLAMLQSAGFDPQAMVSFFGRLQAANRLYEHAQQSYFRTHPFTGERMADIQNRVLSMRYRQHANSLEFGLLRARLAASADRDPDRLKELRGTTERQLTSGALDGVIGYFGLAAIALQLKEHAVAKSALQASRSRLQSATLHPVVEALAADLELEQGRPEAALKIADGALAQNPGARALMRSKARALRDGAGNARETAAYLRSATRLAPGDLVLWEMLAQAESALGRTGQAHRAMAQRFALSGSLPAAVEQLELASRSPSLDFIEASEVDVERRALRARFVQEIELLKGLR